MASDELQQVDNWNDITPPEGETEENDEQTTEETVETTLPERTEVNTAPISVDDDFGVRPGRTTVLPVLDNDTDADGDVLTVTVPGGGPVARRRSSRSTRAPACRSRCPRTPPAADSFTYQADDGRGGKDTASVQLTVHDWNVNAPPKQKRITALAIESGGTSSPTTCSPTGSTPTATTCSSRRVVPAEGDEADFTADGRITYRALGLTQGRKDVAVIVSDGEKDAEGIVRFDVRPPGSTDPGHQRRPRVGARRPVGDRRAAHERHQRRQRAAAPRPGRRGARTPPCVAGLRRTTPSPSPRMPSGVYYVQYLAAVGSRMACRASCASTSSRTPTATFRPSPCATWRCSRAAARCSSTSLVNDSDPGGGILVIQSVSVDPDSGHLGLGARPRDAPHQRPGLARRADHASATRSPTARSTADGEVVVIPVPAPAKLRPPVANDDQVVVRAGDVVTIPVLDNDYHPNGDTMHVAPDLVEPLLDPRGRRDLRLAGHRALPRGPPSPAPSTPPTRSSTAPGRRMPATSPSRSSRSTPRPTRRRARATSSPACSAVPRCASPSRSTASTRTATRSSSSASPPRPARAA